MYTFTTRPLVRPTLLLIVLLLSALTYTVRAQSLQWSRYTGHTGSNESGGTAIKRAADGSLYILQHGRTTLATVPSFPTSDIVVYGTPSTRYTETVQKYSADGRTLTWARTFSSPAADVNQMDMSLLPSGEVVVLLRVTAPLPEAITSDAWQPTAPSFANGGSAMILAKLSANGTLTYGTYIGPVGGSTNITTSSGFSANSPQPLETGPDGAVYLALNVSGNATTLTGTIPTTANAFRAGNPSVGTANSIVMIFNSDNTLRYSTYLNNGAYDIVVAPNGDFYTVGWVSNPTGTYFITPAATAAHPTNSGGNGYVLKMSSTGQILGSTFSGESQGIYSAALNSAGNLVGVERFGRIYVFNPTLTTESRTSPVGVLTAEVEHMDIDASGRVHLITIGQTIANPPPTTIGALQAAPLVDRASYYAIVDCDYKKLVYSTFISDRNAASTGTQTQIADFALNSCEIYITGRTSPASGFPVTPSAYNNDGTTTVSGYDASPVNTTTANIFEGFLLKFNVPVLKNTNQLSAPVLTNFCAGSGILPIDGTTVAYLTPSLIGNALANPAPFPLHYQWQVSTSPTGPWTNIASSDVEDYSPAAPATPGTYYYQRLVRQSPWGVTVSCVPACDVTYTSNVIALTFSPNKTQTTNISDKKYGLCKGSSLTVPVNLAPSTDGNQGPYAYKLTTLTDLTTAVMSQSGTVTSAPGSLSLTVNQAGTFLLQVTDSRNCTSFDTLTVEFIKYDAGARIKFTCGNPSIRLGGPSPAPEYANYPEPTFSWTPTAGLDNPNAISPTLSQLPAVGASADYFLTLNGCPVDTVTVSNQSVSPLSALPSLSACQGAVLTLGGSQTAQAGVTYEWAPGLGLTSTSSVTTNLTTLSAPQGVNVTTYYLKATNGASGCAQFTTQTATVYRTPNQSFQVKDFFANRCTSQPPLKFGSLGTPSETGISYNWQAIITPGTATSGLPTVAQATGAISDTGASAISLDFQNALDGKADGTYEIRYIRTSFNPANPACTRTDTAFIMYTPCGVGGGGSPSCALALGALPSISCGGPNNIIGPVQYASGGRYVWSRLDGQPLNNELFDPTTKVALTDGGPHANQVIANPQGLTAVSYRLTLYSASGDTCRIDIKAFPGAVSTPNVDYPSLQSVCQDTPYTIQGPAGNPGLVYAWTPKTALLSLSDTLNALPTTVGLSINTSLFVTVTDPSTSCFRRDTVALAITPVDVNAGTNGTFCFTGASVKVGTGSKSGYTYQWTAIPSSGVTFSSPTSATTTASLPASTTGTSITLVLTATNGNTPANCTLSSSVVYTATSGPAATIPTPGQLCTPGGTVTIGPVTPSDLTYAWTGPGIVGASTGNTVTVNAAGTYSLTVTQGSCSSVRTVAVTAATIPTATTAPVAPCTSPATIGVTNAVAAGTNWTYSWDKLDFLVASAADFSTISVYPTVNTTYTLTATHASGCTRVFTFTVPAAAYQAILPSTIAFCEGKPASLPLNTPPSGGTVLWTSSPASATAFLSSRTDVQPTIDMAAIPRGTYSFTATVTYGSGCRSVAITTVTIGKKVESIAGLDAEVCIGSCIRIGTTAVSGINYEWSTTPSDSTLTSVYTAQPTVCPKQTTTYTLTYFDASGCVFTDDVIVKATQQNPTLGVTSLRVCQNVQGNATVSLATAITANTGASTTYWLNSATDIAATNPVSTAGTYYIKSVTADGLCSTVRSVAVSFNNPPIGLISANYSCDTQKGILSIRNFTAGARYDFVAGNAYTGSVSSYTAATAIPSSGLLSLTLTSPPVGGQAYTVRLFLANGCTTDLTTTLTKADCQLASLGDFVFFDADRDGQQGAGETGVASVTVTLYNAVSSSVVSTTLTDAAGAYFFTNLDPGQYYVQFSLPTNYTFTTANSSSPISGTAADAVDSDASATTGQTTTYTLTTGQSNSTVDAGIYLIPASLGNFVFLDVNANGQQDPGEAGIPTVAVSLLSSGTLVASTTTDASGLYSFTGLTPGVPYSVSFTSPASYSATLPNVGNDATDSDGNPATGLTGPYTLTANENNTSVDMGYYLPASLGDFVFVDNNRNGTQDGTDAPLPGVTVTLVNNGTAVATTTTNASGIYSFTGLTPGIPYSVSFTTPANYSATSPLSGTNTELDSDPVAGITAPVTLTSGQNNTTLDAGFTPNPSLTVAIGTPTCSTATNLYTATGTVSLTNSPATSLTITDNSTVIGVISLTLGQTSAGFSLSGISNASSHTIVATLAEGTTASTTYLAPVGCASLIVTSATVCAGGTVSLTATGCDQAVSWSPGGTPNGNILTVSTQSSSSQQVLSFTATCASSPLSAVGTVTINPAVTATLSGNLSICAGKSTTLTATGGTSYQWNTGAPTASIAVSTAGVFSVTVTSPAGCSETATATVIQNPNPAMTTTSATICAGETATLNVSGADFYLWETGANTASIQVAPTTTTVYSVTGTTTAGCSATATATVVANGQPQITSIAQSSLCIGNTASLTVNAINSGAGTLEYSLNGGAFTTSNSFTLNAPTSTTATVVVRTVGSLCTATESVVVNCACLTPVSLTFIATSVQTCAGNPASYTVGVSGALSATLSSSGTGVFSQSVISGRTVVSYQPSVADASLVSVTLTLTSADPDGVGSCASDQASEILTINPLPVVNATSATVCAGATGTLTASGASTYLWSNGEATQSISVSAAGVYSVTGISAEGCSATASGTLTVSPSLTISPASLPVAQVGAAYSQTLTATGGTPGYSFGLTGTLPGGLTLNTGTGVINGIPTSPGVSTVTIIVTDNKSCSAALPLSITTVTASLGNFVFLDVNANGQQDPGEAGIPTVAVSLLSSGTLVASTTTDASGLYSFTGLTPGVPYSVSFTSPASYSATLPNVGNDATDSDGNPATGLTGPYTLTANENNTSVDMGYITCPTITNPSPSQTVCSNATISSLSVATNATDLNSIRFVYFSSPQSGTAMYSGGITLGTITPVTGVASLTGVSPIINTGTTPVSYYVYALLNPVSDVASCRPYQEIQLTINPIPMATATGGTITCLTPATVTGTSSVSNTTFNWTGPNGFTSSSQSFTTTVAGNYLLSVTANGCSSTSSVTATVDVDIATPTVTINSLTLTCAEPTATMSATASPGVTYTWSTGATTPSISVSAAGPYSVTVTSANGCTATTTTTVISNTAVPTVTASVSNTLTPAQPTATISTTASAGVSYEWNTGQTSPSIVVNSAGTYSVTVTSANGCTVTTTTTVVSDTAAPTVTASVSNTLRCTALTATISTTASAGVSYLWSNGATSPSITVSVAGAYSVTVTAQNGATAVATTTVISDTVVPTVTASVSNTLTCTEPTATISTTASPGVTYAWSTGATTPSISVSAAGPYSVTVTSANGCTATTTTTVISNTAVPTVTASVSNTLTPAQPTATISTTASAGVSYEWNTGQTSPSIVVNSAGTYSVTVTSANGCTATTTTTVVSDTALPTVAASVSNDLSCTALSATISTTASPGVNYLWSNGATSPSISVSTAGPYSVTVTAQNGATASVNATVFSNTATPSVSPTVSNTLTCTEPIATVSGADPTPGSGYAWSGPGGFTSSSGSFTTGTAGTYSLTVTGANGCTAVVTASVVSDTAVPTVSASVSNTLTVNQPTATISTTATPGATYVWSTVATTPTITVSAAGTYSVTVTSANGCTATTTTTVVSDTVAPTVAVSASNDLSCNLLTSILSTTATPGVSYLWSTGETTANITVSVAGPYSVTVTAPNGATASVATTVSSNTTSPTVSVNVSNTLTCTNPAATITSTDTPSGNSYLWIGPGNFVSSADSFTTGTAGTYSLTVTGANGCTTVVTTTVFSDTALPTVTASVSNTLTVNQPTATISTTASAGVSYEWNTGATTPTISVSAAGTYSVTVTSANDCTATTTTTVVSDTVAPTVTASVSNTLTCAEPTAAISTTASPGVSYVWSTGAITPSITVSADGPYSVTVTAQNGATAVTTTTVVSNTATPALTASVSNTLTCAQPTATISTTITGNEDITYLWSTGAITQTLSVSAAGPYSVTVTSANGCTAVATTTVVSDTALPTVTASVSNTLTPAQPTATISTTASAGVSYEWNTGQTSPSIVVNSAGTYSVTVTSANGCTATTTTTVVSDTALPTVAASVSNDLSCTALTATISTTASPGVNYLWSNGATSPSISVSVAGPYSVTVTAQNGATASVNATVFSNTATPSVSPTVSNTLTCTEPIATVSGADPTPGSGYAWSGPGGFTSSSGSFTTGTAGTYSLTVTGANGCTAVFTTTVVSDTAVPTVSASVSNTLTVNQPTATISTTATPGATYVWSTGATTPTITVSAAGTYSVTVTSANGCTATTTTTVVSDTVAPTVTASVSNTLTCAEPTATISTTASTDVVSYRWGTGETTPAISVGAAGPYSVTVTAQNGATAVTTTTVVSNTTVPTVAASVSNMLTCAQPASTVSTTASPGVTYQWNTGETSPLIMVNTSGTYSVTVTATNGCSAVTTTNVISNTVIPTVTASVSNTLTVNQPTATISTVATAGVSYLWSTGETTPTISVSTAGTYSVTVTSANGCNAMSLVTVVSDMTAPTVTASVSNTLTCSQPQATLSATASPGVDYLWSTGETTPTISVSTAGVYSVTVTAPNGATAATSTTVVSDTAVPTASINSLTLTCANPSGTLSTTTTGGSIPYAYLWNSGTTAPALVVTATGPYSVTVTGANGCTAAVSTTVVSDTALPAATVSASNTLITTGTSVTLIAGCSTGGAISWSTGTANAGLTSIVVSPTATTTYSVTCTTSTGCAAVASTTVVVQAMASMGDLVFTDLNRNGIQDEGDTPLQGVVVILLNGNNTAIASTTTSASGIYSFTGLTPGVPYSVSFVTPAGFTSTSAQVGGNDATDSDANPATGQTRSVTLAAGETNLNLDAGYQTIPMLTLAKAVDKSKAQIGDTLTYTLILTNAGSGSATTTVRDSLSTGLRYVNGSVSVPVGTTFLSGDPVSLWSIPAIAAGTSLSLTFQVQIDSSGILYNTATIPGDTVSACTSIPVTVCPGDQYVFRLTAPAGRATYRWYRTIDGVTTELTSFTTNSLDITTPGEYKLSANGSSGCADFSCCPFIVELDTLPTFNAVAVASTVCVGSAPQAKGQLVLSGFRSSYTYQYSEGDTFNPMASLSGAAQLIPVNGVLVSNLASPASPRQYTIRVYNRSGCFTDLTVVLAPTVCDCPAEVCVPFVIKQTKRGRRTGL